MLVKSFDIKPCEGRLAALLIRGEVATAKD